MFHSQDRQTTQCVADTQYLWNKHLPVNTFPSSFRKYLCSRYCKYSQSSIIGLFFFPFIIPPNPKSNYHPSPLSLALISTSPVLPPGAADSTGMNWNCFSCLLPHQSLPGVLAILSWKVSHLWLLRLNQQILKFFLCSLSPTRLFLCTV